MPTYEYKCDACGNRFERFQSITAAPLKQCPACGKNRVQRLIGKGAGLIFKGSGFYITDYRSDGYKEKAKAESGSSDAKSSDAKPSTNGSPSESKSASKSEAAPAPKADSSSKKSQSKPAAKKD